jgi:hypothetical protein
VLVLIGVAGVAGVATATPRLMAEPGHPRGDRQLLLPVSLLDDGGRPRDLTADGFQVTAAGAELTIAAVDPRVPAAVLVVTDQALPAAAWQTLAEPLRTLGWLGVASADPQLPPVRPAAPLLGGLPIPDAPEPLAPRPWDAVLAGLERLAVLEGAPPRRLLLVLGDLRGDEASEHPVATCVEAARSLAIPVYGVVLPGTAAAARERLARLASASGGAVLEAPDASRALATGLARLASVQGLVVARPDLPLPVTMTVSLADEAVDPARTRVLQRPRGSWRPGPGLVAAGVVLVLVLVSLLGWRQWRRRPVGLLESSGVAGEWRRPVPASGLTVGRDPSNGLVVAENQVSKHHALVRAHDGQVQLVDLRSTNGTRVNGQEIRSAQLRDGDVIELGDAVRLVFRARGAKSTDRV